MTRILDNGVEDVVKASGASGCIDCGKCTAVCPMAEMYPAFSHGMSPRGLVQKARRGLDLLRDDAIWYCTQCNACTEICPEGVSCRALIAGLRSLAGKERAAGLAEPCRGCGVTFVTAPVADYLTKRLTPHHPEYLHFCPDCRMLRYALRNSG